VAGEVAENHGLLQYMTGGKMQRRIMRFIIVFVLMSLLIDLLSAKSANRKTSTIAVPNYLKADE
jgi:hypothetical protein